MARWAKHDGYCVQVPMLVSLCRGEITEGSKNLPVVETELESAEASSHPSVQLAEHMLRRATHRGSDVRLDTGVIMRPDAWPRLPCVGCGSRLSVGVGVGLATWQPWPLFGGGFDHCATCALGLRTWWTIKPTLRSQSSVVPVPTS